MQAISTNWLYSHSTKLGFHQTSEGVITTWLNIKPWTNNEWSWWQTMPHWGKTHWSIICHIVCLVSSGEARAHERWATVENTIYWKLLYLWKFRPIRVIPGQISHILSNFFHSLDGQVDLNPVYGKFNNRHFEINHYTNCDLNHNVQTFNSCFSVYKHELFNYYVKSWK